MIKDGQERWAPGMEKINMAVANVKQSKLHTTVVPSSEEVVVVVFAGVVTGGRVPVSCNLSVTGVGKVAAFKAGARVGLGYGPWNKCKKTVI